MLQLVGKMGMSTRILAPIKAMCANLRQRFKIGGTCPTLEVAVGGLEADRPVIDGSVQTISDPENSTHPTPVEASAGFDA